MGKTFFSRKLHDNVSIFGENGYHDSKKSGNLWRVSHDAEPHPETMKLSKSFCGCFTDRGVQYAVRNFQ